jgi:TP901 family phage tail tape measure protein
MSNLVEILVTAKDLTGPAMTSVNAKVNGASAGMAKFHKTALLAGAAFAMVGVEAVKMASKFDSEMTLLHTQAGVANDQMGTLKKGVLGLAGKVAQDPDSLAESLFHVESNFESMGISSKKALALTETAAKGATVGHADLVDVTNALTAAVASGIPGVQNFDQAMGVLNATVGVGDMKMQDLANAFGSGMVATVKGFGLNITDVGAALAVFGDNNIRGALAGNQLRMSVMALAKPVAGGAATLESLGLQADTLARDMQKGGLKLALEDLVAHMKAAGVSSDQQGQIITDAFGRKAGAGLNVLVGQMDRLESKYPALEEGAKNFSQSWEDTKKTFAFQMKSLEMSTQALLITIGEKLIPPVRAFVDLLVEHKTATLGATAAMVSLLGAVVLVSAAMKTVAGVKIVWSGLTTGAAAASRAFETAALKSMYMRDAFVAAGGGARGLGAAVGTIGTGAKMLGAIAVVAGAALVFKHFSDEAKKAKVSSDEMAVGLKSLAAGKSSADLLGQLSKDADNLHQSLGQKLKSNDSIWDIVTNSGAKTSSAKKDFKELGSTLADMVKNGDAKAAAIALQKITDSGRKVPTKYLKDYQTALRDTAAESDITAAEQGKFGKQAQSVQAALDVQAQSAKGLADSLQALDAVNQGAYNSETKFEEAISAGTALLKENGATLDIHTDKGRNNRDGLSAIAAATDDYTAKLVAQNASWDTVNGAYERGYSNLVKDAMALGQNRDAAEKLAGSLLHLPADVKVHGDISDLEKKLATAKAKLKTVPPSKKAAVQADIRDLEAKVLRAKWDLAQLGDKNITITTFLKSVYSGPQLGGVGHHAGGGVAPIGETAWVGEEGPELMQVTPAGTRIFSNTDSKKLAALNGIKVPGHAKGTISKAQQRRIDAAKAEADARREAAGGLGGLSYFSRVAGYKTPAFQRSTAGAGGVDDLVGTLNEWRSKIQAATHGAQESKLLKALGSFGAGMIKNERALNAVNDRLASAKDKLTSLKDSFAQLRDSVASSVVSYGSIAKSGTGQPGGAGSVVNQLSTDVATAKRFAADLATLKKKGLNSQSLSEIAAAGIDGGGMETAERLLGASGKDITQINSLEKQLKAVGTAAGKTTADAMYGAGIKAAAGLVKGLESQQKKIENVMVAAANAMAKTLKKAFGVKASGGTVGMAATGGARGGPTLVGERGVELADLPPGTRVHSAPDTERMLSRAGSWGSRPIELTLELGGQRVAKVLIDPLREEIRELGGDVQKVLGRRS